MLEENKFVNIINSRTSIRKFKKKNVPENMVEQILKSAQRAPTACRMEPYSFIIVTDSEKRRRIKDATVSHKGTRSYMDGAPVWIMICIDFARQISLYEYLGIKPELDDVSKFVLGVIDASLAAENMVITAETLDLGSCFVGSVWTKPKEVSEILNLPMYVYPFLLLCIGYPDEDPRIRERWPYDIIVHKDEYSKVSEQQIQDYSKHRKNWSIGSPYKMEAKFDDEIKEKLLEIGFKI
jgi:nitroreductase